MKFDLKRPCSGCPFLKLGGVKHLGERRSREIAEMLASHSGGSFPCHKTTVFDEEGGHVLSNPGEQHCAGALLFMEKVNEEATQTIRIAERLGLYDKDSYSGAELVFDTVEDMVEAHTD